MLVADAGRAVALASLALALALDRLTFAQIVAVALVEGTLFVFFQLSESAALPQVVAKEQLATALAQNQAREQGAELAGAPLGGILFGLARLAPFLVDAVSYAVSFVTLLALRRSLQQQRDTPATTLVADIGEGVRWYWRQPFLKAIVGLVGATNVVWGAVYLVLIVRAKDLGASPSLIGAMFAFSGGGAVVGALIAPRIQRTVAAKLVLVGVLWLDAVGFSALVLLPSAVTLGLALGVLAAASPPFNVVLNSYRYALVPDRLLGRTGSVARLVTWGSIPLGPLLGGWLAEAIGARSTLAALGGVMLGVAIGATLIPSVRRAPDLSELIGRADPTSVAE
jgi:predicted MFS family arabinose efflux permease